MTICATYSSDLDLPSAQAASPCPSTLPPTASRPPHFLVSPDASVSGPVLYTSTSLSFWGGTDPSTGTVVDVHHPLAGVSLSGSVLALPAGRGSCSGSLGVLECIASGKGPVALVLAEADEIMALGALVARTIFGAGIPVAVVGRERHARLASATSITISPSPGGGMLNAVLPTGKLAIPLARLEDLASPVTLTPDDEAMLSGARGLGAKEAMSLVVAMARMYGATSLTWVTRAHIDAVIYVGPATLAFARHFAQMGCHFAVPTTINAVSAPREWEALGVPREEAEPALAVADAYMSLGADSGSRTCAPYFLPSPPGRGESVGWAESNAVIYANSVLGARTLKYPDMLDVAVALTGRAPLAGAYLDEERRPTVRIDVTLPPRYIEEGAVEGGLFWPLLGYCVGAVAGHDVVVVYGLEGTRPRDSDLKAFGAAFGTSSGSPMFHIRGVTPEAPAQAEFKVEREASIGTMEMVKTWDGLNSAHGEDVGLVALGNPHLSVGEFEEIAALVKPRLKRGERAEIPLVLTAGRRVVAEAEERGCLDTVRRFGATIVQDTCWCMVKAPVVPEIAQSVITNSAKYAHYGPGGVGKPMYFAGTGDCIQAAVSGRCARDLPSWLRVGAA